MTRQLPRHIVVWLLLVLVWLGAAANGTVRLKNYDIWKNLTVRLFATILLSTVIEVTTSITTLHPDKQARHWVI